MRAGLSEAPLSAHVLVDTRCPEAARDAIGRIFCPHLLRPARRRPQGFHARHHSFALPGGSLNFVAYGAEVEIDPGELARFYLLQWPLAGAANVRCGGGRIEGGASLLSPTLPTRMVWGEGCEQMIVLIEREAMARQWQALTGERADVAFEVGVPMAGPVGARLRQHVELMYAAAEAEAPAPYRATLAEGLRVLALTGLRHDRMAALAAPPAAATPGAVRRAEAYIDAHLEAPLTMAEIAAAARVNLRSLQSAFRRARGRTMSEHIQARRLERLRCRLADPQAPASVTELVYSVGLAHLGRASAAYRARFGETPRETLRRR
jgi:AraC-like DNA-binding protein